MGRLSGFLVPSTSIVIIMQLAGLADELDALARRLGRLSLANMERAHEAKSDVAFEMIRMAGRIRAAGKAGKLPPLSPTAPTPGTVQAGFVTDPNGNRVAVVVRPRRRGHGRIVSDDYR